MKPALFVFLCFGFSPFSFAVIGSITDPGFTSKEKQKPSEVLLRPLRGSFKTRFTRNLIRSEGKFFSPFQEGGFFDTLSLKSDLSLKYSVTEAFSSLKNSSLFNEMDLFFILSYQRPAYADFQEIRKYCFKLYLCFSNMSLGVLKPFSLKESRIQGEYSFYLNLPYLSKSFVRQKKLLGIGSSLSAKYPVFLKGRFNVSGLSSHFLDISVYGSKWADSQQTFYNQFLSLFNQVGLQFQYSKNPFIPSGFIYMDHRFSLNLKGTPFHTISLGGSSVWSVSKALHLAVSLNWGDEVLKPEGTAGTAKTRFFNPDSTFISGGFGYFF